MNPPAILGMLYFQKLHQQPLGGVIIAFHLLADLANLMIGWQMCKRTSKESHTANCKAVPALIVHETQYVLYIRMTIALTVRQEVLALNIWTGETYFYIHCQLDTCRLPNCHCHL